ncbi:MAG: class I SAM-dependent methyltransferase [Gemmataceae bacterium]
MNRDAEKALLDRVAQRYDSGRDIDHYFSEFGAELVLADHAGRLLEVGCASGVMTRRFVGRVDDLHVLDGSAKYLETLQRELGDRAGWHVSLAEDFSPAAPFDGVVLASLLEHVEDPVGLLRRAASWLAPGGSVFVIVPNARSLHRQVGVAMGMLPGVHAFTERDHMLGHRRVYDLALLREHLDAAGLEVRSCRGIMMKVVSNGQLQSWQPELIRGLLAVGLEYPDLAAQIYVRCTPRA